MVMALREDAMHPMFAELFMKPDEEPEAGERRPLRRARRSRQLRTVSTVRGKSGAPRAASSERRPS
jgi:hypothetical protein